MVRGYTGRETDLWMASIMPYSTPCRLTSLTQRPASCHSHLSSTWSLAGWDTHSQVPGTAALRADPRQRSSPGVYALPWPFAASSSLSVEQEWSRQGQESQCQLPNLATQPRVPPDPCLHVLHSTIAVTLHSTFSSNFFFFTFTAAFCSAGSGNWVSSGSLIQDCRPGK